MDTNEIDIYYGDFEIGAKHNYLHGILLLKTETQPVREKIKVEKILKLKLATPELTRNFVLNYGCQTSNGALIGPGAFLLRLLAVVNPQFVIFICEFKNHKKFIGVASDVLFNDIQKRFNNKEVK